MHTWLAGHLSSALAKADCTNAHMANRLPSSVRGDGCAGVSLAKIARLHILHTGFKSLPIRTHLYYILYMYNYEFFSHKYITDVYKCNLAIKTPTIRANSAVSRLGYARGFFIQFSAFSACQCLKILYSQFCRNGANDSKR